MAVFITGMSQMHWGQVTDLPPHWNVDSQQWANSRRAPASGTTMAQPIDLTDFWPGPKKPDKGYWDSWSDWGDWEDWEKENASKWQCKWENEGGGDPDADLVVQGLQEANPGAEALQSLQKAQERSPGHRDICPGVFIPK